MTSRTIRQGPGEPNPGQLKEIVISCDHLSCDVTTNDTLLRDGGGLRAMGWTVLPTHGELRHYCPDHPRNPDQTSKE